MKATTRARRIPVAVGAILAGWLLAAGQAYGSLSTYDYVYCGSPKYATMRSYTAGGVTKHHLANQWPYRLLSVWDDTGSRSWHVHRTYTSLRGSVWQYTTNEGGTLDGAETYAYCRLWR